MLLKNVFLIFMLTELLYYTFSLDCSNIESRIYKRELLKREYGDWSFKRHSPHKRSAVLNVKFQDENSGAHIWDSKCIRRKRYVGKGEWELKYDFLPWCRRRDEKYHIRYSVKKSNRPHKRSKELFRKRSSKKATHIVSFKIDSKDQCVGNKKRHIKNLVSDLDTFNDGVNDETATQLEGETCDQFLTQTHAWQGGYQGKLKFKIPQDITWWKIVIQVENPKVQGMSLQEGSLKAATNGCKYIFKNYPHNGQKNAGDIFESDVQFHYQWDQTPVPKIAFIKFVSKDINNEMFTMKCGKPQCWKLKTTLSPTTEQPTTEEPITEEPTTEEPITEEPTTEEPATEEPITEEPTTEEPITEEPTTEEPITEEPTTEEPITEEPTTEEPIVTTLSPGGISDSCDDVIATTNAWPGGLDGTFDFTVPQTISSWELTVEFTSNVNNLNFHNGEKLNGDGCHFHFKDKGWNGNKDDGLSFNEKFVYDYPWDQSPKPKIGFLKLTAGSTIFTCGQPQCGVVTPTTVTVEPTSETSSPETPSPETPSPETPTPETPSPETSSPETPSPETPTPETPSPSPETPTPETPTPETPSPSPETPTPETPTPEITTPETETTEEPICNNKHNLGEVLRLSNIFYKAQRSGDIPDNDPDVPWRKDSFLDDGQDEGHDLSGGYFDAGDYVKFGFPMAASATLIAWGLVEFEDGYKYAGQHAKGLETLKWATDYFLKAHTAPNEFYGQCGKGGVDHSFWGRPEEFPADKERPCMKISSSNGGGSDLAGETAAALAASSLAFSSTNPTYSAKLLEHARQLYSFSKNYQQAYTSAISDAGSFYNSWSGYKDELAWAAAWMFKATGEAAFKTDAEQFWTQMQQNAGEFSWDNKGRGVAVLLGDLISGSNQYKSNANQFCTQDVISKQKTPRGIIFVQQWGSNRHAANLAFLCLIHSKYEGGISAIKTFARDQINLMLGDQSQELRSYVVGYGYNPPTKPHHRSSSCPDTGTCNDQQQYAAGPNPQTLYGALVGGDTSTSGGYVDDRANYITNEVAVDYNAGFQSALAGLLTLESDGDCGE